MERDNKKARDEARKEYNDTVRVGLRSLCTEPGSMVS